MSRGKSGESAFNNYSRIIYVGHSHECKDSPEMAGTAHAKL
jgi:hypothetical protein